jgi:DNA-binding transcriptional MerR regulator
VNRRIEDVKLKAGQVAAVLQVKPKQLQNIVDAGYVRPSVPEKGRGSIRLYNFDDVVRLRLFDILIESYGLERARASRFVRKFRPGGEAMRKRYLEIEPSAGRVVRDVTLPPIRLPLAEIVSDLRGRVNRVMETYSEGKRGRPAGWSKQMKQVLLEASDCLQDVTDEDIEKAVRASRLVRSKQRKQSAAGNKG